VNGRVISEAALREKGALELAFIGDCVFELLVRTETLKAPASTNEALHKKTASMVNAKAQAGAAKKIMPLLTEDELAVFHRGRNAKLKNAPKGSSPAEYAMATALECLFGWLYLSGMEDRLAELFAVCRSE